MNSSAFLPQAADLEPLRLGALVAMLMLAAWFDARTMRIPNRLTVAGALAALALAAAAGWSASGARGALAESLWAAGGMAGGLLLLLPLYAARAMGAGDVKLLAMVGGFVGLKHIVPVALCTFIAGGLMALVWAARRRSVRRLAAASAEVAFAAAMAALAGARPSVAVPQSLGRLPYAACIAVGTLGWLALARVLSL